MFGKHCAIWILVIGSCAGLMSCSSHALYEAQETVATADSLWHNGQIFSDSAQLAQAYRTLHRRRNMYPDEYAHACYHYGRLLRAKDDPVAAMQCFINASHSRTHDYHILGRVYSNMGDLCHLASEFPLAYDMYEMSANYFLQNGDTLLYYYGLNNMAYELAEQGKKEESIDILSQIMRNCSDSDVISKTIETKAEACLYTEQYDSVLYYSNVLYSHGNHEANIILLRAKAYYFLEQKDSAVYYANYVLSISDALSNKNSALYILTHCDESKDKQGIRTISAGRSDVQKLIEIRRSKYAVAVQLLKQDMQRKPDKRWILTLVSSVLLILITISLFYIWRKRKQHQHIIRDIRAKEQINSRLSNNINNLAHLQEMHLNEIYAEVEKACQLLQSNQAIYDHLHWNNYSMMSESANRYLYNIINRLQPYNLSEKEIRLCILVLLKASTEQMVDMIPYARSGIGKFKYTTARKLGTNTSQMRIFLLNLLG